MTSPRRSSSSTPLGRLLAPVFHRDGSVSFTDADSGRRLRRSADETLYDLIPRSYHAALAAHLERHGRGRRGQGGLFA